jgi:hypothetical protein
VSSPRSQTIVVWLSLILFLIYGLSFGFLLRMVPLVSPSWDAEQVAQFYRERETLIKTGAMLCSWTGAFMIPLVSVITMQLIRVERRLTVWSVMTALGGAMMSLYLCLPPMFWGVAAYSVNRNPDITLLMHELANLTMTTTDQFYIFEWLGIAVVCFLPTVVKNSPFPRWYGYVTAWTAVMFEAGAIAFLPRKGVFAWDGLFVFWSPLVLFCGWILITVVLLLNKLKAQRLEAEAGTEQAFDLYTPAGQEDLDRGRAVAQA